MSSSPFTPPSILSAPPPPSEVKVRTMRSDLAAMARSGGGLPQFESVKVTGLSLGKGSVATPAETKGKNNAIVILTTVAALALLALLGYLVYKIF